MHQHLSYRKKKKNLVRSKDRVIHRQASCFLIHCNRNHNDSNQHTTLMCFLCYGLQLQIKEWISCFLVGLKCLYNGLQRPLQIGLNLKIANVNSQIILPLPSHFLNWPYRHHQSSNQLPYIF